MQVIVLSIYDVKCITDEMKEIFGIASQTLILSIFFELSIMKLTIILQYTLLLKFFYFIQQIASYKCTML